MIYIYDLEFDLVPQSGKNLLYLVSWWRKFLCTQFNLQEKCNTNTSSQQKQYYRVIVYKLSESRVNKLQIFANNSLLSIRCVVTKNWKMEYLKFVGPPALGAMSVAKYIISRSSKDESFMTGIGKNNMP